MGSRSWQPLVRETPSELAVQIHGRDVQVWANKLYVVHLIVEGAVTHLSLRRQDRGSTIPWRHMQRIKSELCGEEAEAVEIFPAESRLVDTANQRHLWVLPGRLPFGINDGRVIGDEDGNITIDGKPLEEVNADWAELNRLANKKAKQTPGAGT